MEADDRDWLRARRHQIKVCRTDDGQPCLEFDDYEVFDRMDDFLTADCVDLEVVYQFEVEPERVRILFLSEALPPLEELLARI